MADYKDAFGFEMYKYGGLNIFSSPYLPIKQYEKIKRSWYERFFSRPWKPWRRWGMVEVESKDACFKVGNNLFVSPRIYSKINNTES